MQRIKKFAAGEFHTWTNEEIAAFEARWRHTSFPPPAADPQRMK
jgi:hypothetical protein